MFHRPRHEQEAVFYFCGHSLGLQPLATKEYVELELRKWAEQGVEGHFEEPNPWLHYHHFLKPGLALLTGAEKEEVVPHGTLTSNLHLLFHSFYLPKGKKIKILSEANNFPSDRFALETHCASRGLDPKEALIWIPYDEKYCSHTDQIISLIQKHQEEIALIWLSPVAFLSGEVLDIARIAKETQKYNLTLGLDLAHAIGNVPLSLHDWEIDFAVWCSYKYLNGGPGATGGYFVHEKHFPSQSMELPMLGGWWGHEESSRFLIESTFKPIQNADAWQHSNANVLSQAAIRASLDIFLVNDLKQLHEISVLHTTLAYDLLEGQKNCTILTPKESRGNMLTIQVKNKAEEIKQQLQAKNMWVDWREPRIMRFSFCPLYNTEKEWQQFLYQLSELL